MVQVLSGFQGTKLRQHKDIEAVRYSDIFTTVMMIVSDLVRTSIRVTANDQINYSDRIVNLLNTRPNPMYNGYTFELVVLVSALLTSHGYIEITHDKTGEPMNLASRKTSEIELKSDARDRLYCFHRRIDSNGNSIERNIKFENMPDIKFYSLDGVNGLSLLDTLSRTTESDNNGKDFLNNFLRNGTHTGGVSKTKGVLDNREVRDRARKEFRESSSGTKQAGEVVVLDEPMMFDQLEIGTEVLKFIRENESSTREIAGVFGIPLHKFGIETTNMGITNADLDCLSALKPYIICVYARLNLKFNDEYVDREFRFDITGVQIVDEKTRAEIDRINVDFGKVNIDEIRRHDGLAPIPGGDGSTHRVGLNHVNIKLVDEYRMNKSRATDRKLKDGKESE